MPDDNETLAFRVTNENLNRVIKMLEALGGLASYPDAYQQLVLQRSRRQLQSPAGEVNLSRATFEKLPREAQQLLAAGGGLGGRPSQRD